MNDIWMVVAIVLYCFGVAGNFLAYQFDDPREGADAETQKILYEFNLPPWLGAACCAVECALWPLGVIINGVEWWKEKDHE